MMQPSYAKASTTEEPDARKPHVRVVRGALGNRRSYRESGLKLKRKPDRFFGIEPRKTIKTMRLPIEQAAVNVNMLRGHERNSRTMRRYKNEASDPANYQPPSEATEDKSQWPPTIRCTQRPGLTAPLPCVNELNALKRHT